MKKPVVTIETNHGVIKVELCPETAPNTVNNFISLVRKGFYEKLQENGEREDALIMWKRQAMDGTITTVFPANSHV